MSMPWTTSKYRYRPSRLASLPRELDPEEFNITPEKRRADEERLAIRARLKRQYQLQLNDPRRTHIIEDPAMLRWAYARAYNVYTSGRPTPKTSLLGALVGLGPLFFWYYVFKTERNRKEKLIQEGKYVRPFKSLF